MALSDFEALASGWEGLGLGQMFGKPSLVVGKKSLGCWADPDVALKLPTGPREEALALPGAHLFDPSGMGRAMKEWVVIPFSHRADWPRFVEAAYRYLI